MTNTIFELLNFAVLLIVVIIATKKALYPMLVKQRKKEEKEFRDLVKHRTKIQETNRALVQKGQEAKHLTHQLRGKVKRWNAVVTKNALEHKNMRMEQRARAHAKQEKQHEKMQQTMRYKNVLPHALTQAELQLTAYYKKEDKQKNYITSALKSVEEHA